MIGANKPGVDLKIVAIGGGTGLSTMLRGLKTLSRNITAVVTVSDDGGGSGQLREDLGMLPPGDIRNCILALANTEPLMEQLMQYRFSEGRLKGQNFGNLFLAAMAGISSSFEEAVKRMSDVLAVTGKVLPVTLDNVTLCAELADGFIVCGESKISMHLPSHPGPIKRVFFKSGKAKPLPDVLEAIAEADVVVVGPGSLYTSIIPNFLVDGICDSLKKTSAVKIYVCNLMTQPGETDSFSVSDHILKLEEYSFKGIFDFCIVNNADIPEELKQKYLEEGADIVKIDGEIPLRKGPVLVEGNYVTVMNNLIRHDAQKLAKTIISLANWPIMPKK